MTETATALAPEVRQSAERLLARRFGRGVRVVDAAPLASTEARPGEALRCRLEGARASETVVLRLAAGAGAFDPEARARGSPAWRFYNQWAALRLLGGDDGSLAPRLLGADDALGFVITEDSEGAPTGARLSGNDPAGAEEALYAYARGLGRIGAATAGRARVYADLRRQLSRQWLSREDPRKVIRDEVARVDQALEELDFEWTPPLVDDIERVAASVLDPGPFLAYSPGDVCPDGAVIRDGSARFISFESGGFQHALLDGAAMRMAFAACEHGNRLPRAVLRRAESLYRHELARGVPEAEDEERFERGMVEASAYLLFVAANRHLRPAMRFDRTWGLSTLRQRFVYWLGALAEMCGAADHLPALGLFASEAHIGLRTEWPTLERLPLFAAFR